MQTGYLNLMFDVDCCIHNLSVLLFIHLFAGFLFYGKSIYISDFFVFI